MSLKYILAADGKTPIVCHDLMKWARAFETMDRTVKRDTVNGVDVSTVFLGLDHSFGDGPPPILWETMIFGGPHDDYSERYASYDDAVVGHAKACEIAAGTREPD